jgi:hypothetical protein
VSLAWLASLVVAASCLSVDWWEVAAEGPSPSWMQRNNRRPRAAAITTLSPFCPTRPLPNPPRAFQRLRPSRPLLHPPPNLGVVFRCRPARRCRLEICTFLAPSYFLPVGALANAVKGLSWMAGGSTKSVFKVGRSRVSVCIDVDVRG